MLKLQEYQPLLTSMAAIITLCGSVYTLRSLSQETSVWPYVLGLSLSIIFLVALSISLIADTRRLLTEAVKVEPLEEQARNLEEKLTQMRNSFVNVAESTKIHFENAD